MVISQVPSCSEKFPHIPSRPEPPSGLLHVDVCNYLKLHVPNWAHRLTSHSSSSISAKDTVHSPHHLDLESSWVSLQWYLISNQPASPVNLFHGVPSIPLIPFSSTILTSPSLSSMLPADPSPLPFTGTDSSSN